MNSTIESKSKNNRLYREVRYTRNTCLSMSNPTKFFKLKRNGENLASEDYASFLITYFENSRSLTKLTIPDLKNVLGSMNSLMLGQPQPSSSASIETFSSGEHVIVAWKEHQYMWELGVVERVFNETVYISHLISTNREKSMWVFPEEAIVHPVERDQILLRRIKATYHKSLRIRVSLDNGTVDEANVALTDFMKRFV